MRVKVCCIESVAEARLALERGADALGLVSAMPSGPGVIPEARIAEIARRVPPGTATFLLTCGTEAAALAAQHRRCGTTALQLCAETPPKTLRALRAELPGVPLIQVFHVPQPAVPGPGVAGGTGPGPDRPADPVARALRLAPLVDALLLDSGRPRAGVPELGGTGRVHDWEVSRRIVAAARVPVWLAGGLGPANVAEAIRRVGPHGVDVCTGLRTAGRLDPDRLAAFMAAVAAATR